LRPTEAEKKPYSKTVLSRAIRILLTSDLGRIIGRKDYDGTVKVVCPLLQDFKNIVARRKKVVLVPDLNLGPHLF
jgi:hypothetical protein